jgi:hypothetical protein
MGVIGKRSTGTGLINLSSGRLGESGMVPITMAPPTNTTASFISTTKPTPISIAPSTIQTTSAALSSSPLSQKQHSSLATTRPITFTQDRWDTSKRQRRHSLNAKKNDKSSLPIENSATSSQGSNSMTISGSLPEHHSSNTNFRNVLLRQQQQQRSSSISPRTILPSTHQQRLHTVGSAPNLSLMDILVTQYQLQQHRLSVDMSSQQQHSPLLSLNSEQIQQLLLLQHTTQMATNALSTSHQSYPQQQQQQTEFQRSYQQQEQQQAPQGTYSKEND